MGPIESDEGCTEALAAMLLELPDVRRGRMFGVPAFYAGKKMFACVYGDIIGIKVPEDVARRLLEDARFAPFQPYGKPKMREWVQFSCEPYECIEQYRDELLTAYAFVSESQ